MAWPTSLPAIPVVTSTDTMDGVTGGIENDELLAEIANTVNAIAAALGTLTAAGATIILVPTAAHDTDTLQAASCAFVEQELFYVATSSPTAAHGTDTGEIASTAFVQQELYYFGTVNPAWGSQQVNAQTGDYTPGVGDIAKCIEIDNATGATLTIPPNEFSAGNWFDVCMTGLGSIFFAEGAGVTIDTPGGLNTAMQWAQVRVIFRSATECRLVPASGALY